MPANVIKNIINACLLTFQDSLRTQYAGQVSKNMDLLSITYYMCIDFHNIKISIR